MAPEQAVKQRNHIHHVATKWWPPSLQRNPFGIFFILRNLQRNLQEFSSLRNLLYVVVVDELIVSTYYIDVW